MEGKDPKSKILKIGYSLWAIAFLTLLILGYVDYVNSGRAISYFQVTMAVSFLYSSPIFLLTNAILLFLRFRSDIPFPQKIDSIAWYGYLSTAQFSGFFFTLLYFCNHDSGLFVGFFAWGGLVIGFLVTTAAVILALVGYWIFKLTGLGRKELASNTTRLQQSKTTASKRGNLFYIVMAFLFFILSYASVLLIEKLN